MTVLRIVSNLKTSEPTQVIAFYRDLLGLDIVMDHGWIVTFAADGQMRPQLSVASQGGNGSVVPDVSIEVDDVDAVFERANASGYEIVYPLTDEEWGVRRFYVRDPAGHVINILTHSQS